MPELLSAIVLPLCVGLLASLLLDLAYAPPNWDRGKRILPGMLAHIALMLMIYAAGLLVFQRPVFAAVQMLIWQLVIVAVSYVKHRSLREVFLFQDFEYFSDMVRHPRLYIPFFGAGNIVLILVASVALIYAAMTLEANLADRLGVTAFLMLCATIGATGWLLLRRTARMDFAPSFQPEADLRTLGLFGSFVAYARAEREAGPLPRRFGTPAIDAGAAPHLVAVQSESFFDARRAYAGIHPDVYGWLDAVQRGSRQYGTLQVPAWGANTVRSEFAFLSGLFPGQLGVHRFNPYRRLGGVYSLAHALKDAGYRTICVHPYIAGFYGRDRILPQLGFDQFIEVSAFGPQDYSGPYVGDQAVAEKVAALLKTAPEPLFIFVITMENHGPLHLEKVAPGDIERLYSAPPPPGFDDLTIYLRHICNAGKMQQALSAAMQGSARDGWICWYGDHVPILPKVYRSTGFTDGRSDYFLWHSRSQTGGTARELHLHDLGSVLLRLAAGETPC